MRVLISKTIEVDIDELIVVTVNDITQALAECALQAKLDPENLQAHASLINCTYQCLLAMAKRDVVETINPTMRGKIADALEDAVAAFRWCAPRGEHLDAGERDAETRGCG